MTRAGAAPGGLHYASLWEAIAAEIPDSPALVQGERVVTWREFEDRAARVAAALRQEGVGEGASVALYLFNCPEYFEIFLGTIKVRAVPANVNYRYSGAELQALLANSDAEALFYDAGLADRVHAALAGTKVRLLVEVGGVGSVYEELLRAHDPMPPIGRDGSDVFLSYTGGTTGLPKGVLYQIGRAVSTTVVLRDLFLDQTTDLGIVEYAVQRARSDARMSAVPAAPLMHSTGFTYASLPTLTAGGSVVMLGSRSFDADELFRTVERHRPQVIAIVGDAFALPMVDALDRAAAARHRYDTSSLTTICSAGTAWSGQVKARLIEHIPQVALFDSCGCTEGVTYGRRRIAKGDAASTANFETGPGLLVLSPDRRPLPPGQVGLLAGPTPAAGYFKDPEKTEAVFFEWHGEMHAIPGDYGRIEADGTVTLIGRGTTVVNTGGEKVFPAEVEEIIRGIDGVYDCVVLGVPDGRFGQAVAAVVARRPGSTVAEADVVSAVRAALAGYKVPRLVRFVQSVPRAPNGKVDYGAVTRLATEGTPAG